MRPAQPADLPSRLWSSWRVASKTSWGRSTAMSRFLRPARPELEIEAPAPLGAHYDTETHRLGLILEDLTARQATFPNVLYDSEPLPRSAACSTPWALLHARFWNSPRFAGDLAWLETHLDGDVRQSG